MGASADAIRELVEPALASSDLELWDVEVTRDTVRVLVDRPGGIDLDTLASAAGRVVSPLLDDHPELTPQGTFQLEVSSPGIERTLRRVDQFARYLGAEITVKTTSPVAGARRHHGTLLAAGDDEISLAPKDGPAGSSVTLPYGLIERARTVLAWGPAPKPGGSKGGGSKAGGPKGGGASTAGGTKPGAGSGAAHRGGAQAGPATPAPTTSPSNLSEPDAPHLGAGQELAVKRSAADDPAGAAGEIAEPIASIDPKDAPT